MTTFRSFVAADMDPLECYRLLLNAVAPRPIALTSTISQSGDLNLAPFSFFMAGGANPPSIALSPTTLKDGGFKHTLANIISTGEFVVNVVTRELAPFANIASGDYPVGVSEWHDANLTPVPSRIVAPPRALESPIALECRLFQVVRHGEGSYSANYIIGEVVCYHVSEHLFDAEGKLQPERVNYAARMGGDYYCDASAQNMWELKRP